MAQTKPTVAELVSWWKFDEASGDAIDSHGSNNFTETSGTIASTATAIKGTARDFELDDSECFYKASSPSLTFGNVDFSLVVWVRYESVATTQGIFDKRIAATNNRTYRLYSGTTRLLFDVSPDGVVSTTTVTANNLGNIAVNTWYLVIAWNDSVENTINIQVNNGTVDSLGTTGACFASDQPMWIGSLEAGGSPFDGILDEFSIWGKVFSAGEREWFYNAGAGRGYSELFTGGQSVAKKMSFFFMKPAKQLWDNIGGIYIPKDSGLVTI